MCILAFPSIFFFYAISQKSHKHVDGNIAKVTKVTTSLCIFQEPQAHEDDLFSYSCPSAQTLFPNNPTFAKTIRDSYKYLTGVGRAQQASPVRWVICYRFIVEQHVQEKGPNSSFSSTQGDWTASSWHWPGASRVSEKHGHLSNASHWTDLRKPRLSISGEFVRIIHFSRPTSYFSIKYIYI